MRSTALISCLLWLVPASFATSSNPVHPVARPKYVRSDQPSKHLRPVIEQRDTLAKRDETPLFSKGQPADGKGKGAPFSGKKAFEGNKTFADGG